MTFSLPKPNPQSETIENRLLGIALPGIPEILYIHLPIMDIFDIPKIVPKNEKYLKTVLAQRADVLRRLEKAELDEKKH